MTESTICICLEPRADYWQLGPLTTDQGSVFLLGWRLIPWPVDGGMPEAVGRVLVRAMTSLASVTYLCSAEMKSLEDDLERLNKENLVHRLVDNWYTERKMRFRQYFGGRRIPVIWSRPRVRRRQWSCSRVRVIPGGIRISSPFCPRPAARLPRSTGLH